MQSALAGLSLVGVYLIRSCNWAWIWYRLYNTSLVCFFNSKEMYWYLSDSCVAPIKISGFLVVVIVTAFYFIFACIGYWATGCVSGEWHYQHKLLTQTMGVQWVIILSFVNYLNSRKILIYSIDGKKLFLSGSLLSSLILKTFSIWRSLMGSDYKYVSSSVI